MKKLKNLILIIAAVFAFSLSLTSCSKEKIELGGHTFILAHNLERSLVVFAEDGTFEKYRLDMGSEKGDLIDEGVWDVDDDVLTMTGEAREIILTLERMDNKNVVKYKGTDKRGRDNWVMWGASRILNTYF